MHTAICLIGLTLLGEAIKSDGIHLASFEAEAVDGVDVLVIRDQATSIEHREWQPITNPKTQVRQRFPRQGSHRVVIRNHSGRSEVSVVQQPCRDNGYELRVLIDDGPEVGAAPLKFDLFAIPATIAQRPHNILVVTIDSLRADRLGCYGHARPTSPNIDGFAKQCVRFTRAFSTSSFTPPSHASMLTSRYVGDHGLLTWNPMPDEQITLAEVLAAHNYRTGATVNLRLLSDQNLGQGFEWKREGHREARTVINEAIAFLRKPSDRPFFLWVHLYDVHRPYGRIPNWTNLFGRHDRSGLGDGEDHYNLQPKDVASGKLDRRALDYIVDRYDAGIAYTDAQLGPLLAELSTADRRKDTLIIVTADHGESLLEHEERFFTHDLFSSVPSPTSRCWFAIPVWRRPVRPKRDWSA